MRRTWKPVLKASKVGARRCFSVLKHLDGTAGTHHDGQTCGASDAFLTGRQDNVQSPVVEVDIFGADTAHSIYHHERLGADFVDHFRQGLDFTQHARRGIHVRDGDDLVLLFLQGLLHLVELGPVADGCFQLCGFDTVRLEAVGEGVGKVTCVQDKDLVTMLGEIGGYHVPTEGAAAIDDEGLSIGSGGLEEFAEHGEGFAKHLDEWWADMALATV